MSRAALLRLIDTTEASISSDELRVHLNSALLKWEGELVRMVTADGHRLSVGEHAAKQPEQSGELLIPEKGVQELKRVCDTSEAQDVLVIESLSQAFFDVGGVRLAVKLTDAVFPPYQQVIPDTVARTVRAIRTELVDSLKAVQIAASEKTNGVRLAIGDGHLRIEGESVETGHGVDEIAIAHDGPDTGTRVFGFNARYLLDALASVETEEVDLQFGADELAPVVIEPVPTGGAPKRFLAVVMPMRI